MDNSGATRRTPLTAKENDRMELLRSIKLASPQSEFLNFLYQNFGPFLGSNADFLAPILFPKNQILCAGASLNPANSSTIQKFE